ncbi:putative signaling protein [bacterium HR40]|nr:putative signaling protein [bacterium HR40]
MARDGGGDRYARRLGKAPRTRTGSLRTWLLAGGGMAAVVAMLSFLLAVREGWQQRALGAARLSSPEAEAVVPVTAMETLIDGIVTLALLVLLLVACCLALLVLAVRGRDRERAARLRLEQALDHLEHGLALYDAEDRLVFCNRAYREVYPRSAPFMRPGVRFADLLRYGVEQGEYVEALADPEDWIARRLALHERADGRPLLQLLRDGRILRVSEHRTPEGGRVGLRVDVTELERNRLALERSEARFRLLAEHAPVGIWQLDAAGRTVYANPACRRFFGGEPDLASLPAAATTVIRRLLHADGVAGSLSLEVELPDPAGSENTGLSLIAVATPLALEGDGGLLLTLLDVTAERRAAAEIAHLELHDPLTGLGNRRLLEHEVDARLLWGEPFALVLVDVDDLSEFNNRFGHGEGDRLLVTVADRLQSTVRPGDLVFRLGGDEFALLVPGIAEVESCLAFLGRLAAILEQPHPCPGRIVHPRATLAGALFPSHGRSRDILLARAELALDLAKRRGPGQILLYEPELELTRRRQTGLRQRLERALEREEFELVVQPQIGLVDGRVRGAEVLLRWFDPIEREPVLPAEFVPVAEATGLIFELDAWVLERACAWLAGCGLPVERLPRLAVNVSAAHVTRVNLPQLVSGLLTKYALPPSRLELEITESAVVDDRSLGRRLLGDLHALGVALALDDFGTGYASLSYLADLPFDQVKIDRAFIADLDTDSRHRTLVRAIIALGHGLGMEVLAEGLETATQSAILLAEGCDLAQGYGIARPMPLAAFADWLERWDPQVWRQKVETESGPARSISPVAGQARHSRSSESRSSLPLVPAARFGQKKVGRT